MTGTIASAAVRQPSDRWRELKHDRLREAVTVLGRLPGVHGFLVGGSLGRGEPWPMSDIDLLPVYADAAASTVVERERAELVDWWAGSGQAQNLDLGWLAFGVAEIEAAMAAGPERLAGHIVADRRWFHGVDKPYGGHAADDGDELSVAFAAWLTAARFHPAVVGARLGEWHRQAAAALDAAHRAGDPAGATRHLRESARALRMVLLESWGERLGSMGREWTRFERMADRHGGRPLADRIAVLAGSDVAGAAARAGIAPAWLRERIDLCLGARVAVGEPVSPAENARDQVAAFAVHVGRHRPDLDGPWTGTPDPALEDHRTELAELVERLAPPPLGRVDGDGPTGGGV